MWDVTLLIKDGLSEFQISTHTSRVGCDNRYMLCFVSVKISTHTSRVGCDPKGQNRNGLLWYFYSHIPCGMWQRCLDNLDWSKNISTHTSRVGCDTANLRRYKSRLEFLLTHPVWDVTFMQIWRTYFLPFLLTHPVWDVTVCIPTRERRKAISTHTSRVGCDLNLALLLT